MHPEKGFLCDLLHKADYFYLEKSELNNKIGFLEEKRYWTEPVIHLLRYDKEDIPEYDQLKAYMVEAKHMVRQ
jgi:hypothetical protein